MFVFQRCSTLSFKKVDVIFCLFIFAQTSTEYCMNEKAQLQQPV